MSFYFEDPQIRRLKDDLYRARQTILDLTPEAIRDELRSYYHCKSRTESYAWERDMIQKVIAIAVPDERNTWEKRAYCPLCGWGSSSPYSEGFKLPLGLERHLEGYGNNRQCGVMHALFAMARDYFEDKFAEAERLEREQQEKEKARRRGIELLYRIAPGEDGQLRDEGYHYGKAARDDEGMKWAEQRLADIGLQTTMADNVRQYTSEGPDYVVFADPRLVGEITFCAYKLPLPKRRGSRKRVLARFAIPDSWKNNIKTKFLERLPETPAESPPHL